MRIAVKLNEIRISFINPGYGLNKKKREIKIIASLASYRDRYQTLPIVLKSILSQSYKPDMIIVWLDSDIPENQPTQEMRKMEQYGITYRFTDDDIKPHKKYFFPMQEFPDAIIITFDDDILYGKRTIEKLMETHSRYPGAVCAIRTHKMTWSEKGELNSYNKWIFEEIHEKEPRFDLFATGCAGCLYPPGIMPKETFSIKDIQECCLDTDDIWLKFMELLADVPVANSRYFFPSAVKGTEGVALYKTNVEGGQNDINLLNMIRKFPEAYNKLKLYTSE